jgi:hypothetical protein
MCGSGHGACGERAFLCQISSIPIFQATDVRTGTHRSGRSGCGGAGRSTIPAGSCGVPVAMGATRAIGPGPLGFGWWCAHAVEALASAPLVAFRATDTDLTWLAQTGII